MFLLKFIWLASGVLAGALMLIFAVLVLRRAIDEYRAKHINKVRRIVQQILFRYMPEDSETDQADIQILLSFWGLGKPVLRKFAIDLFHRVQGKERERLTYLLKRISFSGECIKDLRKGSTRQRPPCKCSSMTKVARRC